MSTLHKQYIIILKKVGLLFIASLRPCVTFTASQQSTGFGANWYEYYAIPPLYTVSGIQAR
jgi:hypothetical protein